MNKEKKILKMCEYFSPHDSFETKSGWACLYWSLVKKNQINK